MKKLILSLGSFAMIASTAVLTTSCTYIDVVEKSINNRITQAASTTAHFFKGAILTNSYQNTDNEINGSKVDEFIYKSKAIDIMPGSNDLSSMKQIFSTYFEMTPEATNSATDFINSVYARADFELPEEEDKSWVDSFRAIKSLYSQLYALIGQGFSPTLVDQIIPIALQKFDVTNSLNESLISLGNIIPEDFNLHVPTEEELKLTVTDGEPITYSDVQFFFLINLSLFLASSFGYDLPTADHNWKDEKIGLKKKTTYDKYYEYTSSLFAYIINDGFNFKFNMDGLQYLINAIYGLSWYIEAFDQYKLDEKDIKDDNHIFSDEYTNNEIFEDVRAATIEYKKFGNDISGLLQFFTDMFSGKIDSNSYNASRVLKILFQVNYYTDNRENPDYSEDFQLKLQLGLKPKIKVSGSWGAGYEKFENGLSPLLIALINGALNSNLLDDNITDLLDIKTTLPSGLGNLLSSVLANVNMHDFINELWENGISVPVLGDISIDFILNVLEKMNLISENIMNLIHQIIDLIGHIDNRLFHQLMNGTILGKIIDAINGQEAGTSKIKNLKDIFDTKIGGIVSVSDIATVVLKIIAAAPDIAIKVFELFDNLSSTNIWNRYKNQTLKFINEENRILTIDELFKENSGFVINDGEPITDFIIATKLFSQRLSGVSLEIKNEEIKNEDETWTRILPGKNSAYYILGLQNGSFVPDTILYNIAELYNDGSGEIVKGLFNTIDSVLTSIDNLIGEKEKETWDVYLQSNRWSVWIVDFENFEDISKPSSLTYNIQYRDEEYNIDNTYQIVLSLNGDATIKAESSTKYVIESFEKL